MDMAGEVKGKKRNLCDGAGRKPLSEKLDDTVIGWVYDRRSKGLRVSRKMIMKKAKIIYDDMVKEPECENDTNTDFLASTGWLRNFMQRTGLSLRCKTSIAQKDPDKLIDKLESFVSQVRRLYLKYEYQTADIIAKGETPV